MNHNTLDKYYISEAGKFLSCFKWTSSTTATCRCPYCGDSKKKKYKTRGYFFLNTSPTSNGYKFKCHNCGIYTSLFSFLEENFPDIHKQMKFDFVQSKNIEKELTAVKIPQVKIDIPRLVKSEDNILDMYPTIFQLPIDHPAKIYMQNRKIPKNALMRIYYADNFQTIAKKLDPDKEVSTAPRIIFPMYDFNNRLFAIQGRTFIPSSEPKYITIREKNDDHQKIYGLERFNPSINGYMVEGPIDSEFLPNCIARGGAGQLKKNSFDFDTSNITIIFDNEPRNKEICLFMERCLHNGFRVCIWGKDYPYKDINDGIVGGWSEDKILSHIEKNSEKGLIGLHKLGSWRV